MPKPEEAAILGEVYIEESDTRLRIRGSRWGNTPKAYIVIGGLDDVPVIYSSTDAMPIPWTREIMKALERFVESARGYWEVA